MYHVLLKGRTTTQAFSLTREGPPSTELEVLALFPVNRLVPDEALFIREAGDDNHPITRPSDVSDRRRAWM